MRRVLLGLVLLASPAFAQDPKGKPTPAKKAAAGDDPEAQTPDAKPPEVKGPNAEGDYGGVQPGQSKQPAPKKAKKPPPKGTLSWIGFETKNGSEVFFQSIAPFDVNQKVEGGAVVVTLSGLSRLGHNTWRPIDTRFFDTPLARITARKKGKAIEVRIAFKNAKQAAPGTLRTATEADGMYYAYLAFAGGSPQSATPAAKEPEK